MATRTPRPPAKAPAPGAKPRIGARTTRKRQDPAPAQRAVGTALRPEVVGAALVLLALLSLPWLFPVVEVVTGLRDGIVRRFGLGTGFFVAAMAAIGVLLAAGKLRLTPRALRLALGFAALAVALLGVLSFVEPGWTLGSVQFREVTAGGTVGESLTGGIGWLVWLGAVLAAFALLWPQAATATAAQAPGAAVDAAERLIALRLPERLVGWLAARLERRREEPPPLDSYGFETGEANRLVSAEELGQEADPAPERAVQIAMEIPAPKQRRTAADGWQLPSLNMLQPAPPPEAAKVDAEVKARTIEQALASFGVDAKVVQVSEGPTVTQFGVEPGWEVKTRTVMERDGQGKPILEKDGRPKTRTEEVSRTRVRVNQVVNLANDLALALAAPSIRIEAPVPGRSVIGIEVPNTNASIVTLRSVIESPQFQRATQKSKLTLALGKSVSGEPVVADLAKMPHLLIAGATGSGKSVCLNTIVACILMHASPEEVRLVMIDPKRVELTPFAPIPHLAFSRVIVDMDEVVGTLQAVIHEMDNRYRKFAAHAVRNIEGYNRLTTTGEKLPYWVVIIDELADLMMAAPFEVEKQICRLAQLARATGIHLIVATQRPSVDVVTGLIKANFPTRIAFAMSSQVDSRTILDGSGAEKLLGRGDMLFMPTDAAKPRRLQGCFVSDGEMERLVSFWADDRFDEMRPQVFDELIEEAVSAAKEEDEQPEDPMLEKARELASLHRTISASLLQRRLGIGYNRASRLLDVLEEEGIIGPYPGGGGPRPVLAFAGESEEGERE